MTADKLKRVQSIRRWLEKAEQSYTSHKDLFGEWNLIMAQAEMQRLRETDQSGEKKRRWGSRALALAAAAALFVGISAVYPAEPAKAPVPPVSVSVRSLPPAQEIPVPVVTDHSAAKEAAQETAISAAPVSPAPSSAAPVVAAEPVLSEKEIQSVVGEAGRALRGQS